MVRKVVIIGPESTGKSTLSAELAAHYNTIWCPEYAREYLNKNGMNYSYDDLLHIAKGQLKGQDQCEELVRKNAGSLLFVDTDMYVMKVWCEYVFNNCHRFILDEIVNRSYDLYLLCNVDLPWVKDDLREYPDLETRKRLYAVYKDIMINQQVPWVEISGNYEERLSKGIAVVDQYVLNPSPKAI
jgi:NadR type nicotinamide-nucleotide adenylyltransferase